jgi:hypothetical protein
MHRDSYIARMNDATTPQRQPRRPLALRSFRGDGSPLAHFLCPICHRDVLVEETPCEHLLLVQDPFSILYHRDRMVLDLHGEAEREVGARGLPAVERLCEKLGPTVVLYELVDPPRGNAKGSSVLFVVDVLHARHVRSGS